MRRDAPGLARLRAAGASALAVVRRIAGMPDYAGYVRHMTEAHPGLPVLSERAFFEEYVRARYGDGPVRCC